MENIFDFSPERMNVFLRSWEMPAYRAPQVLAAAWKEGAVDFSGATSLPLDLRRRLNSHFAIPAPAAPAEVKRAQDGTLKAAFAFADGAVVESVAIPKGDRLTFCLSSQAGCAMGCAFCATAQLGLRRNLTMAEMVQQIRGLTALCGRRPTNFVWMGMGEPLLNLDSIRHTLDTLCLPAIWNWSVHKSMISTCGWVPGIEAVTREPIKAKLALSLNAVRNEQRDRIMPVNRKFPLEQVLEAVRRYLKTTDHMLCVEYVLIGGVNDRPEDARLLVRLLRNLRVKANLIPLNPVPGTDLTAPTPAAIEAFLAELRGAPFMHTFRSPRGDRIAAACGQLAGRRIKEAA